MDQARAVDRLEGLRDARRQPAHRLGRERPALVHYLLEGGAGTYAVASHGTAARGSASTTAAV